MSKEQISAAKDVDLLSYLQASEPHELRKSGSNEYRTATNGSLVISNGLWYWHKGGFGGRSAIDYLIKIRGMGFVDAVEKVLQSPAALWVGQSYDASSALSVKSTDIPRAAKPKKKKELLLPKPVSVPHKAVKYLQQRGIYSDIIGQCLKSGILYESIYKNKKEPDLDGSEVCVFAGRDDDGKIRFAAQRGIFVDFYRDAPGSDKAINFTFPAQNPNSKTLAVLEAPIDLLSHVTLARLGYVDHDGYRLSLGGTSDVALISYLERNPHIEHVLLSLDNDVAGLEAVKNITGRLANDERFSHIVLTAELPKVKGHDYNEELLQVLQKIKEHKPSSLDREAVSLLRTAI